jgi:DNA-binding CsgD family transcriptional regulator/tetratricopeptide (TPR) repeat protein
MPLLADQLVGRADELGSLDEGLAKLDQGRAVAVELLGEPGIGKTRLLAELAARAEARGHLVLCGSASELERDLPFSVFVDALDEYVQALDPHRLELLDEDVLAELSHVFPSLSAHTVSRGKTPQHERYRTHRAVRALLELLAATKPLVLELDDLHWADSGSVELVGALLRRPPAAPVLMALAVRPRQVPERLSAALDRAHRDRRLARLELGALTLNEARELLGEANEGALAAALYEESGGNPFYLEQLARVAGRGPPRAIVATEPSLGDLEVPPLVAAALTEELALLSDATRLVLEGAAVAGDPFEPELAAAAAATSDSAAIDAVDELLQLDLLHSTGVPRRFRFRHPLVRRAVYERTPSGWRLGAHERCAEALAARGADAVARAHHVERSAREGDLAAVAVLREAGESAARLAPATGARWFAGAVRLLPANTPAHERIELLLACAAAFGAGGDFLRSHEALLEALAAAPHDAIALPTELSGACARAEHLLGHYEQAHSRLVDTLEALPDPISPEAVGLLIELALNHTYFMEYKAMRDWAGRAVSTARELGDARLMTTALAMLSLGDAMAGASEEGGTHASEVAAVIDALSDEELAGWLDAVVWLAGAELYLDRYAEADIHAGRALAVARSTGQGERLLFCSYLLGRVWYVRGRLADAIDLLDDSIEAARLLDAREALTWSLYNRSVVALACDQVDIALATTEESLEVTRQVPDYVTAWAAVRRAEALLETGHAAEACARLLASAGGEELTFVPAGWRAYAFELLTRCSLALGRQADAERAADRARACASAVQLPLAGAWADRAAAAVQLHCGDPARAAEHALAAAAAADAVGAPIEASLARTLAGRALAQARRNDRAVAELQRAASDFDVCGALRYRQVAERELGRLGHRRHRRTRSGKSDATGLESLTARELQLARLVTGSKTNPQIAAELFLSEKTVETHLRNIFRKMSVSSRVELAVAIERADHAHDSQH